jgi:cobalt/nickel transport protein
VVSISKRSILVIILLLILSPGFGIILTDLVGYHEPLDIVAEKLGLRDLNSEINWTPFIGYNVPGLSPIIGYIISGAIGITLIFLIGLLLSKILPNSRGIPGIDDENEENN